MHIGQAAVDAVMAEGELGVIDSQEVKDGGMQIVAISDLVDGLVRPLIRRAVGHTPLDATACEPGGEGEGVVVAALRTLTARHSAELGRPDDDCLIEQAGGLRSFMRAAAGRSMLFPMSA